MDKDGIAAEDGRGAEQALDAVAQALVLADPALPATLEAIAEAVRSLRAALPIVADSAAVVEFLTLAERLAARTDVADADLERLGAMYEPFAVAVRGRSSATVPLPRAETPIPTAPVMPLAADQELIADFVARACEHLENADEHLLELEKDAAAAEPLNAVFRVFHTIKGMAGFLGFSDIERLAHATEEVLDGPRSGQGPLDRDGFDRVFAAVDEMRALVAAVGGAVAEPAPKPSPSPARPAERREERRPEAVARQVANTVRVDEQRLDRLLDTIGELVIAESMFSDAARTQGGGMGHLAGQLARLDKTTRELQEMATSLRMVPLKATFVRLARLVRDLSGKADKAVELVTSGEDTELDKSVVDRIYDPLVHVLRNAVDHGIEPAEARAAAGKPALARIEIHAYHRSGSIHIEVRDDGGGLDYERIRRKAIERGLLAEDDAPGEQELVELLFAPGFSTAETVTDVSGRGVGMDVVRRCVESVHGEVRLISEPGVGTTVALRLPLTLAIIDGMVLRVGEEKYILPMLAIERSVRPLPSQVSTVKGRGLMLATEEGLVPVLRLHTLMDVPDAVSDPTQGVIVIVNEAGFRSGLLACEIVGQQQTVIKPLGDELPDRQGVAGAAIMPDGRVGLILDAAGLVRLATRGAA